MSLTRNLAQSLIRSSRLSIRGVSTTRSLLGSKTLKALTKRQQGSNPIWGHQSVRQMSSTCQFEVINVQDGDDFNKRVLEASCTTPVVVDFHATWCGPCKILGPRLESLLSKEDGKVLMAKVDIDDNPDLAMEYGVRSVPTVVGLKNGKVQNQFIGVVDDDQICTFVDKLVVS